MKRRNILLTARRLQPSAILHPSPSSSTQQLTPLPYLSALHPQSNITSKPRSASTVTASSTPQPRQPSQLHPHPPQPSAQPPPQVPTLPQTYFHLFPLSFPHGSPPASNFTPDLRTLRSEYLRLQAVAHPDRHHTPNSTSNTTQDSISANINTAYKTLQSPLLRAQYLLLQHGIDVQEEGVMEGDKELLMEVLEAREEIEEAENEVEIEELKVVNNGRVEHCVRELERAVGESRWQEAGRMAVRLRYWMNIGEGLEGWEKGKPVVLVH
ncbi:MAG: hypothetical protein M1835_007230 [Candelina submexicana]|nr:MAG: hypothetical protein M1835_007230 [Candelina submexicana]